jgi:Tfp pilus assembly protein PilO
MRRANLRFHLSQREAALLLALLLLALAWAGWRFLCAPLSQRYTALRREHAALLVEEEAFLDRLRSAEAISAVREQQHSRAEALQASLPSPERLPVVLSRLEALLGASPVSLDTLQVAEMEAAEGCAASRVRLRLSGEREALLKLLESLEQFEHLLLIDQLGWFRSGETADSLDLSFRLFFHPPP